MRIERFHKTLKGEFLSGRVFESLEEAQAALDVWVGHYNTVRPHQGIGMVPPARRFELAVAERFEVILGDGEAAEPKDPGRVAERRVVTRRVDRGGRISLAKHRYHVGRWLESETVEVAVADGGLIEVTHRGVLVASHVRRHPIDAEPAVWRRQPRARPVRPPTVGRSVVRKVDSSGNVSFAGTSYRAGNAYRRQQVEVSVVGDTVQISAGGRVVRTHPARHDPDRTHGAFANPGGRPRRINAAS